jgi:phosphoadenosine phosphosulfate reductase
LAKRADRVCVFYSGGKDSLVTLDLAVRVFGASRVTGFFKFTVPDLEIEQAPIRWAEEKYGVQIVQAPKLYFFIWKWVGAFCDATPALKRFLKRDPPLKWTIAWGMELTGCRHVLTGMKDSDGLKRRQFFANCRDSADSIWRGVHHPIRHWRKSDVLGWIQQHGLYRPPTYSHRAATTGVGLNHKGLCWLHDEHPEDFRRLERWFPYIGACVARRDFYGVGVDGSAEQAPVLPQNKGVDEEGLVTEE